MSEKFWLIAMAAWIAPVLLAWFRPESWEGVMGGVMPVLFALFWTALCWAAIITCLIVRHI